MLFSTERGRLFFCLMVTKLTDITTDEVSLVGKGANKKKFLLFKSKEGTMEELIKELLEEVKPLDGEKDLVAKLKKSKMSEGDIAITQAALRLLSGVTDGIKKSGIVIKGFEQEEPAKVDAKAAGEYLKGAKPEDRQAVAQAAGIEPERFEQAFAEPKPDDIEGDILKADGSLDEKKVPKELRPALQLLFKDRQETKKQLSEANEKIEKAEKEKKRSAIQKKAEEVKDVPSVNVEELTDTLMKLDEEDQEKLLKPLRASAEAISKGKLFGEKGRPGPGLSEGQTIEKVNELAKGLVQKNDKLTEADAIQQVLKDHPELYADYVKEVQIRA